MSILDDVFNNPDLSEDEKLQKFSEILSEIRRTPDSEGVFIPNVGQIRKYIRAAEILGILFRDSVGVRISNVNPEYFNDSAGGRISMYSTDDPRIVAAVFGNRKSVLLVSEFLSLVDDISVNAERSLSDELPGFIITIDWAVLDTMIGAE